MAEKNSMPERAIAQTEIAAMINNEENREVVHKKDIRMLHGERTSGGYVHPREDAASACCELYTRVFCNYLPLNGKWLTRAGFCYGVANALTVCFSASLRRTVPESPVFFSRLQWVSSEDSAAVVTVRLFLAKTLSP